jgi:endoglycosylceramidase
MVASADHYMVPWIEWAYCGCRDPTGANPASIEAIVLNPRKPPFGSNVVASTLRALVEPYPQAVAGTPLAWSFDRATRVFRLRYSRRRADARGRFGFGALTAIATPALVYHGRYGVSVRGGTIRSRPGAGVLVIAGCIGTKTISVTVQPRGSSRETCAVP